MLVSPVQWHQLSVKLTFEGIQNAPFEDIQDARVIVSIALLWLNLNWHVGYDTSPHREAIS